MSSSQPSHPTEYPLALPIAPGRSIWVLYGVAAFICVASLTGRLFQYVLGYDPAQNHPLRIYIKLTNVDAEANISTWFQSGLLLVNSLALLSMAQRARRERDRWSRHWALLALAFAYLSLDEFAVLHEKTIPIMRRAFHLSGPLTLGWVLLAIPAVIIFGLVFVRFLMALPQAVRRGFLIAGGLYVGGAAGFELVEAEVLSRMGNANLPYVLASHTQELLEMLGSVVLLATVVGYAQRRLEEHANQHAERVLTR